VLVGVEAIEEAKQLDQSGAFDWCRRSFAQSARAKTAIAEKVPERNARPRAADWSWARA
jgi:hypothetical protein